MLQSGEAEEDAAHRALAGRSMGALGRKRGLLAAGVVALVIGGAFLWRRSLGPGGGRGSEVGPERDVPRLEGNVVRFSPSFAERSKLKVARVETAQLAPMVSVTGTVAFDPERVGNVGAQIAGRIRAVRKYEGDHVEPGEALAELVSAELGAAQAHALALRARVEAAEANDRRERELFAQHATSEREAEEAKAQATVARAELFAAEQRVKALGGAMGGETGVLAIRSPLKGKVIERHVSRGQYVEPTLTAFRVGNLDTVWIELDVFERQLGAIRRGDAVEISPQTNLSTVLRGVVAHVGEVIDRDTRSAPVRVEVDNKDEALRPGQSVLARISTKVGVKPAIVIPRTALVTIDGKDTVFVSLDPTSVEARSLKLGSRDAHRVEVEEGLTPEDSIVSEGVFALKAELFR